MTSDNAGKCEAKSNTCTSGAEYLAASGCVTTCPANEYVRANTDAAGKKSCIQDVCEGEKVLKKTDGTCEACAEFTKKKDSKTCEADTCIARQKLLSDGSCGACPDYFVTKAADAGQSKECEEPKCA